MKKKTKKILMIAMAAVFGILMVGSSTVALFGGASVKKDTSTQSITGTPADNYPVAQRTTYCESGSAQSNSYITEFKIPTACTQPLGITTDPSGNVWFAETNTGKVAEFDPITKQFTEYNNTQWQQHEKSMIWGIGYVPDGNIWFTDSDHNLIWKFSPTDKTYTNYNYPVTAGQQPFPQMLVVSGKNILINDFTGRKLTSFDSSQPSSSLAYTKIPSPGNFNFTSSLAVDPSGKIWYTVWIYQQGGALVRYDPQTQNMTEFVLPAGIIAPNGVSITQDGKVWVTDTASSYFFSFDPQTGQATKFITSVPPQSTYGNATGVIKSPITRPYWNHVDDKGRVWFNEQVGNTIAVFDSAKESLVEYLVPSKNPNWSDCGGQEDCGVAQVLDFTTNDGKVWFTEWVENNIGFLDPIVPLPFDLRSNAGDLVLNRGANVTESFTISPNEQVNGTISMITSNTSGPNNLYVYIPDRNIVLQGQPKNVSINISADDFASSGTYKVLVGVRYNDITISKFLTVTIK